MITNIKDPTVYEVELKGLSTDTKPTNVGVNSLFIELDTEKVYQFNGSTWEQVGKEDDDSGHNGGSNFFPDVSDEDNGKVVKVVNGQLSLAYGGGGVKILPLFIYEDPDSVNPPEYKGGFVKNDLNNDIEDFEYYSYNELMTMHNNGIQLFAVDAMSFDSTPSFPVNFYLDTAYDADHERIFVGMQFINYTGNDFGYTYASYEIYHNNEIDAYTNFTPIVISAYMGNNGNGHFIYLSYSDIYNVLTNSPCTCIRIITMQFNETEQNPHELEYHQISKHGYDGSIYYIETIDGLRFESSNQNDYMYLVESNGDDNL